MSAEMPEVRVGQRWRHPRSFAIYEVVEGPCEGLNTHDEPYTVAKAGEFALQNVKSKTRWDDPGTLADIAEQLRADKFGLVADPSPASCGAAEPPGVAVQILEIELRERLARAADQPAKKRVLNALAALEGIAEFLGVAVGAEGGAR